jgi:choline dehydrogenase
LTADPADPVQIETHTLSHPDDPEAVIAAVQLCREIDNSAAPGPFTKREVMPGNLTGGELGGFVRDAATKPAPPRWARRYVRGRRRAENLWTSAIADGSIKPRVTTRNTQAPCVIIGEPAADILKAQHTLSTRL